MSRARDWIAGIGTVAALTALLFVFAPGYASLLTVPRVALTLVGVIAAVEGFRSIQERRRNPLDAVDPPAPEAGIEPDPPGTEFDRLLLRWSTWRDHRRIASIDQRVYDRLRDVAAQAVAGRDGVSRAEAEDRVERGTWTDDPIAAAFLNPTSTPSPPLRVRLRGILRTGSVSEFYTERTIEAIASVAEDR